MSDVPVNVQGGGDTVVRDVFKVVRDWLAVDVINTGNRNCLVPPRDIPKRKNICFKIIFGISESEIKQTYWEIKCVPSGIYSVGIRNILKEFSLY